MPCDQGNKCGSGESAHAPLLGLKSHHRGLISGVSLQNSSPPTIFRSVTNNNSCLTEISDKVHEKSNGELQNILYFCWKCHQFITINHNVKQTICTRLWSEAWEPATLSRRLPQEAGEGSAFCQEACFREAGQDLLGHLSLGSQATRRKPMGGALGALLPCPPEGSVGVGPHGRVETASLFEDPGRGGNLPPLGAGTYFTRGVGPWGSPGGTRQADSGGGGRMGWGSLCEAGQDFQALKLRKRRGPVSGSSTD